MRRFFIFNPWFIVAFIVFLPVLLSLRNPRGEPEPENTITQTTSSSSFSHTSFRSVILAANTFPFDFNQRIRDGSNLQYNFYRDSCPQAEDIVRSAVTDIYFDHRDLAPSLLRLFFHDCFIQGCDASLLLEDNVDRNGSYEKQAIPNQTLKGFDKVDLIKEEVEQACPGVVSCADILALAARDSVLLGGGPFYPVLTGRRDSLQSFFQEATDQIPRPDDSITRTLHLFNLRGFNERETVGLLGGHNIGKIGCDFIQQRLYDFQGTGKPDPSIPLDFLSQMRLNCPDNSKNNISSSGTFSTFTVSKPMNVHHSNDKGMSYMQALSSALPSGASFDTHYYQSLLRGRGLLFADQQLMAQEKTARLVSAYASDDGSTFRMDFARVMLKLSNLDVLTGNQGQVRLNCSRLVSS
ncbi:putative peroxidase [Medicago truncatula]|uniref:Peroxidase n=1 Tax=Medicago truncatula TaxID=3880 RepID=A0A396J9S7_MEDTR|nr:putative Peroxidase 48 [Medicago truncatula]RHN75036.1 putative peroxidase [Medicago truncatula]